MARVQRQWLAAAARLVQEASPNELEAVLMRLWGSRLHLDARDGAASFWEGWALQIQRAVLSHRHALQQRGADNVEPLPDFPTPAPTDRSSAARAPEDHGWAHVGALLATLVHQNLKRAPGEARRPLQAWDPSWLAPVRCPFPPRWRPQWYLPWSLAAQATQKSRTHAAILEWAKAHPESIVVLAGDPEPAVLEGMRESLAGVRSQGCRVVWVQPQ